MRALQSKTYTMENPMEKMEIYEKHKKYLAPCVTHYYKEPLILDRGKGKYVYDIDGREYLDFFGGIVTISGTEAIETAILLAQLYTKSHEVIALRHCYSGLSLLAMNITAHANWRLAPSLIPGIKHAHNAYCFRCAFGMEYPNCNLRCARDVKELIETTTSRHISAFIAEPIQGVGGFITPPKEYFKEVVSIIRSYGGLFICDEVQTGWGGTGEKMFGIAHWGVEPDIMVMAKGAANGAPIGITIATPEVGDALKGLHLSTFGGNPVTATAVIAP